MPDKKSNARILKNIPDEKIAKRLETLRNEKGLTQAQVAELLQPYVKINLEGNVGRSTISNLENRQANLTVEMAIAYSKALGVSLEYVLCLSEHWWPEDKTIKEELGLSDRSIDTIRNLENGINSERYDALDINPPLKEILNTLFEEGIIKKLINALENFVLFTSTGQLTFNYTSDKPRSIPIDPKIIAEWFLDMELERAIEKIKETMLDKYSDLYKKRDLP